ncbi:MAG TPA: pyruvate, phosphate dikinase [Acidimicrobiia bacterium]|nr:pyruvate, phosphate dikinase [Acidimicrobiia bacterium]
MSESAVATARLVDFDRADPTDKFLLGGKGAGLAHMISMGLDVPPGFTVTTHACREFMRTGEIPDGLWEEVTDAVARLEQKLDRTFGGGPAPLLVSVRSGAVHSMPGMMDTVLNLGINGDLVKVVAEWADDEHFAYDAYRRFLQMYSNVVLGLDMHPFERALARTKADAGADDDTQLTAADLRRLVAEYDGIVRGQGAKIPDDPTTQLTAAITAVFRSWDTPRAKTYRRINGISEDLGTAANVQAMVFGDLGPTSGTGVCFTRDPSTGEPEPFGDYLPQAQGEDVVAGIRNTLTLADLADLHPDLHAELLATMQRLEQATHDMADIEFTIERKKLWILQTRSGKRTAAAAVRIATDMVDEGLISAEEAVLRVDPAQLEQLERPRLADKQTVKPLVTGIGASPGAAQGLVTFDPDRAVSMAADGTDVILVSPETTPDDIHGMHAARGILTSQGGKTSHAAVVARGMGKPAVTGAAALVVDEEAATGHVGDTVIHEGDEMTIDGTNGAVYLGRLPLIEPRPTPELERLLAWADEIRQIGVRANADTGADAAKARASGAEGIGLARTEHMFMGERLQIVQRVILADNDRERNLALRELSTLQIDDFESLLEAMDGLPVVVRLLDPPLHEFLPDRFQLQAEMVDLARKGKPIADLQHMASRVASYEEDNPMLGLRGVRLGLVVPDLYEMQARAAVGAVIRRLDAGGDPHLEIMIPLVSTVEELRRMRDMIRRVIDEIGRDVHIPVGTMIELPRAALTAGEIAGVAEFFSFGTNDLTQMTYGLSRDDAEGSFLGMYLEEGILTTDPFQTIDVDGVGRLIRLAVKEGREANPALQLGVCGEHGGDPASIAFCRDVGLDYVSCSPPRIHVARLAAAQAEIRRIRQSS